MTLFTILKTAVQGFMGDEALELSAALAYRFFLAIVPFFIFLAALSGFAASLANTPDVTERVRSIVESTVPSNVGGLLVAEISAILTNRQPGALSISLVFTLWAATGATLALMRAMNMAYDVTESRPFLRKNAIAVALTLLAAGAVLGAFVVLTGVRFFTGSIADLLGLSREYETVIGLAPLPLLFLALAIGSGILYWLGPNLDVPRRGVIPGAILFAAGWLVATYGFSLYVQISGGYEQTYGALGAVVVFLMWLYVNGALLLAGAELNAAVVKVTGQRELEEQREQKRTEVAQSADRTAPEATARDRGASRSAAR